MELKAHDEVPTFTVTGSDGRRIVYHDEIWQRQPLVLATFDPNDSGRQPYADALLAMPDLHTAARIVVTTDAVAGLPPAAILVADEWGEIYWVSRADTAAGLPPPSEAAEWVEHVRHQCPECQGETR